jgi:hypothetical protein
MADQPKPYFDEEKQKKAVEWINRKCADLKCECCGTDKWQLMPDLVSPTLFRGGLMLGGGPIYPCFALTCFNCGNTKLFNAIIAEVLGNPLVPQKETGGGNGN